MRYIAVLWFLGIVAAYGITVIAWTVIDDIVELRKRKREPPLFHHQV